MNNAVRRIYPTYWTATEDGHYFSTVDAPNAARALIAVRANPRWGPDAIYTVVQSFECSGLAGDPNHQGAHCSCRY